MSDLDHIPTAAHSVYLGIWSILATWFRVPRQPPTLPTREGEEARSFRPSPQWLKYLIVQYWCSWTFLGLTAFCLLISLLVAVPLAGILLAVPLLALLLVPAALTHLAIYLQYDTTWYVMNSRSLRLRRGIWTIHESTITFENIQNVAISQGPLQRWFGIADVVVQTAGGGGVAPGPHGPAAHGGHLGLLAGLDNAVEVRNLILGQLRHSRSAGLGDEAHGAEAGTHLVSVEEVRLLREIRDQARRFASP